MTRKTIGCSRRAAIVFATLAIAALPALAGPTLGTATAERSPADQATAERLAKAINGVVKIRTKALPDARSLQTLGAEREGSAVIVGPNDLALTIGYLIIEAETIELVDNEGKAVPATTVAYDHSTGFGLVRALAPLSIAPVPMGDSKALAETDSAIFATAGGVDAATSTMVVSKRRFAGYWEYMIDDAIFTSPPRFDHSGAALINREGKLVGIGSLIVADAANTSRKLPGNMFVPIDLLKPIFDEMIQTGSNKKGRVPWIGVTSQEMEGRVYIQRVQADGPAERAGIKSGDILLGVGTEKITKLEEFYRSLWKDRKPGDEVPVTVLQGTEVRKILIKSIDRSEYVRTKAKI